MKALTMGRAWRNYYVCLRLERYHKLRTPVRTSPSAKSDFMSWLRPANWCQCRKLGHRTFSSEALFEVTKVISLHAHNQFGSLNLRNNHRLNQAMLMLKLRNYSANKWLSTGTRDYLRRRNRPTDPRLSEFEGLHCYAEVPPACFVVAAGGVWFLVRETDQSIQFLNSLCKILQFNTSSLSVDGWIWNLAVM